MFGFFKKNKTLPTFAPLVTDMHCHLLPLVDDGSKSLEESLEVMEAMHEVGYEQIRLTPHFSYPRYQNDEDNILESEARIYFRTAGLCCCIRRAAGQRLEVRLRRVRRRRYAAPGCGR